MSEYLTRIRSFSYNARLYMLHVIGMDMIHGTWGVIFNLYLLAAGKSLEFVGLRILIQGIASAVTAIPAGIISDRIGRKASFILGDGVGAVIALVSILTTNDILLLSLPVLGALFSNMHGVAEPAFMAENSAQAERIHLFSVGDALRTFSAAVGMLVAGWLPHLAHHTDTLTVYRLSTFAGIGLWFLSLIPALMLKSTGSVPARSASPQRTSVFGLIRHPGRVFGLVAMSGLMSLGYSFVGPLMSVWFQEGMHAHEHEIGTTFAVGNLALVAVYFLAPLLSQKIGQFNAIFWSRMIAVPFMVLMSFSPHLAHEGAGPALTLAGTAYVLRSVLANLSSPIFEAFSMEVLDPQERATYMGVSMAVGAALTSAAGFLGARLMEGGDYQSGFFIWAASYLAANLVFWTLFRRQGFLTANTAVP